jgi:zinc transporter 1
MVHSLALVADSFHMLNDVMSLIVALYAIKLASRQTTSPKYSYGWQRAEILGALINGVFLLALCLSIFLEAVQRFFEPQHISQPILILVVGSAGLASNLVGLVLFHDHGHSHGDSETLKHPHSHDIESEQTAHIHEPTLDARQPTSSSSSSIFVADENGAISDILPETIVRRASSPSRKRSTVVNRQSFASVDDIFVSPSANRRSILSQAQEIQNGYHQDTDSGDDGYNGEAIVTTAARAVSTSASATHKRTSSIPHDHHNHAKPKDPKSREGGHSHENLNMKGVFLHVLGDALGNIGVIATALFIWLTDFSWKFYADPVISLIITGIIFSSALPLVKCASLILLQAVPRGISLDDVKEDILHVTPLLLTLLIEDQWGRKCSRITYLATF